MTRPIVRNAGGRPEYMAEAIEHLVSAPTPAEAFGALAGRLLSWLSCQLVVLQVKVGAPEPLLFQGGGAVTLPGIGVGWRTGEHPQAAALAEGEIVVHADLHQAFSFAEDANLIRAGLRSAVRGALLAGGREIGRFGVFAEQANHFTPQRVQILREVAPALRWLCRQAALAAQVNADSEVSALMDEVISAATRGLHEALRACRIHLSRLIPAAGMLAVLESPAARPSMLIDQVGIGVPGIPTRSDPDTWRQWLAALPPEGKIDSLAWIFPIQSEGAPVGALAIAFPQGHENPDLWQSRLRPMISLLAMLVEFERSSQESSLAARTQLGALASGLADEIGNLMTELALQVDLLQACLPEQPEVRQRSDALMRLVEKGTGLSSRLEQMASSQRNPDMWESLISVVERVGQHLRTYQGGKHIALQSRLGELGEEQVEAGLVEHELTQLILTLAQGRTSEVRIVLRAHPSPLQSDHLVLWLSEEHAGDPSWQAEGGGPPVWAYTPKGVTGGSGLRRMLEVPIRSTP
ncbi:MAG: hypothetical protein ACOY93_01615 [Bacillota bacterium]